MHDADTQITLNKHKSEQAIRLVFVAQELQVLNCLQIVALLMLKEDLKALE